MLTKAKQMALYRWFRPADGVLDPKDPLSHTVSPNVIAKVRSRTRPNDKAWFVPLLYSRGEGTSSEVQENQRSQSNSLVLEIVW